MGSSIGYTYEELLADKSEKLHILDDNHCYQLISSSYAEIAGIIEYHRTPSGQACGGLVLFVRGLDDAKRPIWTVESLDPLTISPSVLCKGGYGDCVGDHGYIREGKWIQL